MQNPDIKDMISSYLRANGFTGLVNTVNECDCEPELGCAYKEIRPKGTNALENDPV